MPDISTAQQTQTDTNRSPWRSAARWIAKHVLRVELAADPAEVTDDGYWTPLSSLPNERPAGVALLLYRDAVEAYRQNPIAKRIVDAYTDYIIADGITVTVDDETPDSIKEIFAEFIQQFWNHPKNRLASRLPDMADELTRSGDLFPILFQNEFDGMSYVRVLPKSKINEIVTQAQDWETEIYYVESATNQLGGETMVWYHPDFADDRDKKLKEEDGRVGAGLMMHFPINRIVGALMGEGELNTILPWLRFYSRMLEDRVRINALSKIVTWWVKKPNYTNSEKERKKAEAQFGSVQRGGLVVTDDKTSLEAITPKLNARDAKEDLTAVRRMIQMTLPPTFMGEADMHNKAGGVSMLEPTHRRLKRRQEQFGLMLVDVIYHAAQLAAKSKNGKWAALSQVTRSYIEVQMVDISREDNQALATAASQIASAMKTLKETLLMDSVAPLDRWIISMVAKFGGDALKESLINDIEDAIEEAIERKSSDSPAGE